MTHCDCIQLNGIAVDCILGCNPEERTTLRPVLIDLVLYGDFSEACKTDDLAKTVDYDNLTRRIRAFVSASSFQLIEALSEHIAQLCLEEDRITAVDVAVTKPAPCEGLASAVVRLHREK